MLLSTDLARDHASHGVPEDVRLLPSKVVLPFNSNPTYAWLVALARICGTVAGVCFGAEQRGTGVEGGKGRIERNTMGRHLRRLERQGSTGQHHETQCILGHRLRAVGFLVCWVR